MTKEITPQQTSFEIESTADSQQYTARKELNRLYKENRLPEDDLMFNLGLFTRSSLLVKYLILSNIYEKIVDLPGEIVEFGTWWGQNLILLENLRAIHEPFNKQRRIIGFDTFEGYTKPSKADEQSDVWQEHSYSTGKKHKEYLENLLITHEKCNILGHIHGNHKLIEGNIVNTAPKYFQENNHSIVALAYFDVGLYEPTKAAMEAIKPHLIKGSVILLDELTWNESPGEAIAFKETFSDMNMKLEKIAHYPSKSIATVL